MSITIELPADIEEAVRADAAASGSDLSAVVVRAVAAHYSRVAHVRVDASSAPMGGFNPFDLEGERSKYGLPPARTREEIADAADRAADVLSPEQRAAAQSVGLL
jgi:hypothetical protein